MKGLPISRVKGKDGSVQQGSGRWVGGGWDSRPGVSGGLGVGVRAK